NPHADRRSLVRQVGERAVPQCRCKIVLGRQVTCRIGKEEREQVTKLGNRHSALDAQRAYPCRKQSMGDHVEGWCWLPCDFPRHLERIRTILQRKRARTTREPLAACLEHCAHRTLGGRMPPSHSRRRWKEAIELPKDVLHMSNARVLDRNDNSPMRRLELGNGGSNRGCSDRRREYGGGGLL